MRSLHIDLRKGFGEFKTHKLTKFPDNSLKFSVGDSGLDIVSVITSLRTNEDILVLGLVLDFFEDKGTKIFVRINYMMYQQDDRRFSPKESFGLRFIARFLNQFKNVLSIEIFHPHSDKVEMIDRCKIVDNEPIVRIWVEKMKRDAVWVIPDSGAFKTQFKQVQNIGWENFLTCMKSRSHTTGEIETVVPTEDLQGKDCFIVDDICLGGRTAIAIAEILKKKNCGKLYLMVSHGVFNYGVNHLLDHFEKIYTTDSICTIENDRVEIIGV